MSEANEAHITRARGTARLFEQLARRVLEKRNGDDLHAAQWSALRYFARAGRRTATVTGLSRYLGNTNGSTSRTARSLVDRGLLDVRKADYDGRAMVFVLTEEGERYLENDPLNDLTELLSTMDAERVVTLGDAFDRLHGALSKRRGE